MCPESSLEPIVREEKDGFFVDTDLRCASCVPIREGVPDIVSERLMTAEGWDLWQRHLEGFQARRMARADAPDSIVNQFDKADTMQQRFAAFAGIKHGKLLDVGCGPGKFRRCFPADQMTYFGIDPIPLGESVEFPYMRALAEHLPFKKDSLDHVAALAALDHCQNREAFFREVARVLKPGGEFHLLQSVHDVRGPLSLLKWMAHEAKDKIEDRTTKSEHADAPKHMNEYGRSDLLALMGEHFEIVRDELYSPSLLNPYRLFITMRPR